MLNLLLFIISFCLVMCSTYFFTAIFKSKRPENTVIFFLLNTAVQVILSFEILSILKSIDPINVLKINLFVWLISFIFWNIKKRPKLISEKFDINFENIKTAVKKDKILLILGLFFLFSVFISFFLAVYAPVNQWDSTTYHFARIALWIQHKSLEHFETSSVRQVMFPPNAEILYLWFLMFIKKDFLAGMVQFLSFCGSVWVLFSFLSYLKVSTERILWAVFVFSSLPAIILQSSSTQNDLVLGFALFVSLYLFMYGIREKEQKSLIFSAIALALSIGIKASVFMFLPAFGIVYVALALQNREKQAYKPLLLYAGWTILFFILLSSYNYILNYLEFRNPLGLDSYIKFFTLHAKSLKSFIANFIRYNLCFVDFTGFAFANIFSLPLLILKTALFGIFRLNENQGLTYTDIFFVNTMIHENSAAFGPIGFLVFMPLIYRYGFSCNLLKTNKKDIISLTAMIFLLFLLVISLLYGFALWNIRYFVGALVIASPVFALNYNRKLSFMKVIVFVTAVACFINISLCDLLRPIIPVNGYSLLSDSREEVRYKAGNIFDDSFRGTVEYLAKNAGEKSKIGLIFSDKFWYYQFFNSNPDWRIFPLRYELLTKEKLKNLDYIVICNNEQLVFNLDKSKNYLRHNKIDFNLFKEYKLVYKKRINTGFNKFGQVKYELENPEVFYIFKKN